MVHSYFARALRTHSSSHELTPDLPRRRREICGGLLRILETRELDSFQMLVTGDASSFVSGCQHSIKRSVARGQVPIKVNQTACTRKIMLTVIWEIGGFHIVDVMPPRGRFNTECFLTRIIDPLLAKVLLEETRSHALRLSVHLDNCRVHSSKPSNSFDENSTLAVPHPPYSPDLTPPDF
jgi:hypothetical protein